MALITRSLAVIRGVELFEEFDDAAADPAIRLFTIGAVASGRNVRITAMEQNRTPIDEQKGRPTVERDMPFAGRPLRLVTGEDGTRLGTGLSVEFEVSR